MRIGVAPASTRTCTAAIRSLLEQSSNSGSSIEVRAWYRDLAKAPSEFLSHPKFEAVQGDVSDASSFAFEGCDVILTVPPPFFTHEDMVALTENLSRNIKSAIEKSTTVKRLVMLSSMGAHLHDGVVSNFASRLRLPSTNDNDSREKSKQRRQLSEFW